MSEPSEDFLACLAFEPWRPRSLQAPRTASLSLRWRVLILVATTLLHVLAARWFVAMLQAEDDEAGTQVMFVLDFTAPAPRPAETPPAALPEVAKPSKPRRRNKLANAIRSSSPASDRAPNTALQVMPSAQTSPELRLYDSEGRMRVPDDLLEQIDKQVGDQRVFSYQIPHMDDARKEFYRNRALAVETTRFEQYWQPDQDMLTALLSKLVEKTTKEIRIPVPGQPGSTMVCMVSMLALGGGCRVLTNGSDYVGPVDDPNTLDAEEDRQCQAWWNQIIGAKTQDFWRKTRALYEAQCRIAAQ